MSSPTTSITLPSNYCYVLVSSAALAIFCHVLGFIMGGKGRAQAFEKEFMKKHFEEQH